MVKPVSMFIFTLILTLATILCIIFLVFNKFTRKETVQGWIEPEGLIIVKPQQEGRLKNIFVHENTFVQKGDLLFSLNVDQEGNQGLIGATTLRSISEEIKEIKSQIESIKSRKLLDIERLETVERSYQSSLQDIKAELSILRQSEQSAHISFQKLEKLKQAGYATDLNVEQRRLAWLSEQLKIKSKEKEYHKLFMSLKENRLIKKTLPKEYDQKLSDLRRRILSLEQQTAKTSLASELIFRAPVSGRIISVYGKTGQLRSSTQPVISLSPRNSLLEANLLVPASAIGFLKTGQKVNLMIDAFPYQKFGVHKGYIRTISKSSFLPDELHSPIPVKTSVYQVRVALKNQFVFAYGQPHKLLSGMTLQGDLIIDRRTLFEWVFEPLFSAKHRPL